MAVTAIEEVGQRPGSFKNDGSKEITRTFRVTTNNTRDGQLTVINADLSGSGGLRVPRLFDKYQTATESDDGMRVVAVLPSHDQDDFNTWLVTVNYSSLWRSADRGNPNPLLRPPLVNKQSRESQRPIEADLDGQPIATSAGEGFDPPVTQEEFKVTITITLNLLFFDAAVAESFKRCTNEFDFHGFGPGQARLSSFSTEEVEEGEYFYERVRLVFEGDRDGFEFMEVLDQGYMELVGGEYRPILRSGVPVSKPALLNGLGVAADPNDDPQYQVFRVRTKRDFAELGVPT